MGESKTLQCQGHCQTWEAIEKVGKFTLCLSIGLLLFIEAANTRGSYIVRKHHPYYFYKICGSVPSETVLSL